MFAKASSVVAVIVALVLCCRADDKLSLVESEPSDFHMLFRKGDRLDFMTRPIILPSPNAFVMFVLSTFSGDCDASVGKDIDAEGALWNMTSNVPEVLEVERNGSSAAPLFLDMLSSSLSAHKRRPEVRQQHLVSRARLGRDRVRVHNHVHCAHPDGP